MFKKILKYFIIIFFIFIALMIVRVARAENLGTAFDSTLPDFGNAAGYKYSMTPEPIIATIIQATLSLLGIIFIILMIYGGGIWMTAKGNEQQVDKAKGLITAAIIGLVIVVAAYAISYFVIQTIGKGSLKNL